jgi:serine phosphatase RsbU (regulator of sigma subunit)
MAVARAVASSYLVPLSGPPIEPIELKVKPGGLVLGRHEQCNICLPADAEKVSRFHARFDHDGARWRLTDLGSRWGTFVNGVRVPPQTDIPLTEGDLIRIVPWTFSFGMAARRRGIQPADDANTTIVRVVPADSVHATPSEAMLPLLLESAAAVHAATDEKHLADLIIDAALRGTGLQNAALLRPIDSDRHVEIIASRFGGHDAEDRLAITFSRSLIEAAMGGTVAEINSSSLSGDFSQSIVQLQISSAICVPLMLGGTVAALLYLDSRGPGGHGILGGARAGASAFCVALGRMASLALANLKRVEMEKREAAFRAELSAAAAAQKWIMPQRLAKFGPFRTIGESRPGQYIGGDFFDLIPLGENKLAVALGDVSGKGISASVLMTATQGYLHAAMIGLGDPQRAVQELNRFVTPRRPEGQFVTLWIGVFDAENGTLTYVDAGHGYAWLARQLGALERLDKCGGIPIGVDDGFAYQSESVKLEAGCKALIVSDGIIEQSGLVHADAGHGGDVGRFRVDGLEQALLQAGDDEVADLFEAVVRYAGVNHLSDDATAVLVRWSE